MTLSPAVLDRPGSGDTPRALRPRRLPERGHPTAMLAVILVAQLMVMLDLTIVNVALPEIQTALDFSPRTSRGCSTPTAWPSADFSCSAPGWVT